MLLAAQIEGSEEEEEDDSLSFFFVLRFSGSEVFMMDEKHEIESLQGTKGAEISKEEG